MKKGITAYTETGSVAAVFYSVRREGDKLVVNGKALGVMSMDMIFTPEEICRGLKMALCWAVLSFILLLPYFGMKRLLRRL